MSKSSQPLLVEIVAYAPTVFYHCTHCEVIWKETGFSDGVHEEQVRTALPPDLLRDYQALSDWVAHLVSRYQGLVDVRIVDAASVQGLWKTARHGLRRYPAVLVAGRCFEATDFAAVEAEIERHVATLAVTNELGSGRVHGEGGQTIE
jgi:hypothetical protein